MKSAESRAGERGLRILAAESGATHLAEAPGRWMQENNPTMTGARWKIVAYLFVLATLIGVAEGTQVYVGVGAQGREIPFARALASTMPSWYVLAFLLPPTIWLARRFRLDASGWRRAVPVHLVAAVVFTAVHLGLSSLFSDYVLNALPTPVPFLRNLTRLLTLYFVLDTLFYWALVGGYYAFEYGRRYREREAAAAALALKASRLETSLSRANLEALRMQLNPHFLFNTLNTVAVLAMKGERQRVLRMINRLSDLLRLALENSRQTITLGEEVDFVLRYLEIEQVRFRDRLSVHVDVPDELLDAEVPSLLLQPVVENAVLHGVGNQADGAKIEILARREGNQLQLVVQDSGPGFGAEQMRSSYGVGLSNTAARLEQLYGADHLMTRANRERGGAIVTIKLPYRTLPHEVQDEKEWKRSVL
ncbi:MAG TPA: sensor histidine kinase [Longimicrobiales bacterium]|nr:sensor histidine kinase [Longimicrobiales bacterium]